MFRGSLVRLEAVVPHLGLIDLAGTYVYVDATNRSALAGANLSFRTLDGMTLVGFPADLTGAVFDGASIIGASFDLAEFAGATFHGVKARQASFRGARFSAHGTLPAASFAGATNLTERGLRRGRRERRQLRRGDPDRRRVQPGPRRGTTSPGSAPRTPTSPRPTSTATARPSTRRPR